MGFKLSHSLWSQGYHNCHSITRAAPGRAAGWRGISHMPCVAFSSCELWLGLAAVGKRGGSVSGRYKHRDSRSFENGLWAIIAHHDSHVRLDSMVPALQHSAVTSTLGRVRIWWANPKDTEGVSKGKPNQIISSNPDKVTYLTVYLVGITKLDHFSYLWTNDFLLITAQICGGKSN